MHVSVIFHFVTLCVYVNLSFATYKNAASVSEDTTWSVQRIPNTHLYGYRTNHALYNSGPVAFGKWFYSGFYFPAVPEGSGAWSQTVDSRSGMWFSRTSNPPFYIFDFYGIERAQIRKHSTYTGPIGPATVLGNIFASPEAAGVTMIFECSLTGGDFNNTVLLHRLFRHGSSVDDESVFSLLRYERPSVKGASLDYGSSFTGVRVANPERYMPLVLFSITVPGRLANATVLTDLYMDNKPYNS